MKVGDTVRVIRNQVGAQREQPNGIYVDINPDEQLVICEIIDNMDDAIKTYNEAQYSTYGKLILFYVDENNNATNYIPASDVEVIAQQSIFTPLESYDKGWLKTHVCTCDIRTLLAFGCKCKKA